MKSQLKPLLRLARRAMTYTQPATLVDGIDRLPAINTYIQALGANGLKQLHNL